MPDVWTSERVESLRSKIAEGKSAQLIGEELNEETGAAFTRNAIIGKAHRLGLHFVFQPYHPPATRVAPRRIPYKPRKQLLRPVQPVELPAAASLPQQLLLLRDHHCRWIEGDRYCGQLTVLASSWCADHRRRAITR